MNQATENAIQAEAKPKFDSVSKPLLSKHYAKVKPLGVSFVKFVSVIGRLNGRYGVES